MFLWKDHFKDFISIDNRQWDNETNGQIQQSADPSVNAAQKSSICVVRLTKHAQCEQVFKFFSRNPLTRERMAKLADGEDGDGPNVLVGFNVIRLTTRGKHDGSWKMSKIPIISCPFIIIF